VALKREKIFNYVETMWSSESVVGTATSYGLDDLGAEVRVQQIHQFSLLYVVQIGNGTDPAYPMGTGGPFPGGKVAVT
jgi:hypothetical protein